MDAAWVSFRRHVFRRSVFVQNNEYLPVKMMRFPLKNGDFV